MKIVVFFASMLFGSLLSAATPIDGFYSSFFGGYAYVPGNIDKTNYGINRNDVSYQGGFDGGGNIGYKSNPMRYEGEISYLKVNTNKFKLNSVNQTSVSGYNQAVFALANIYYDFATFNQSLQPFLGVGIGYGWTQAKLDSGGPSAATSFSVNSSAFAYQGNAGITYNFAENYALTIGYRYITTLKIYDFGKVFQAHIANIGATYRFDGNNYK
ncbi:MAG: outer membrane beta-barrel protein [Legionellaceae bacterium]|nr:outer membrane beta-barrel protein [Legionellaceae bacterium]